jgi:hypothetical protein
MFAAGDDREQLTVSPKAAWRRRLLVWARQAAACWVILLWPGFAWPDDEGLEAAVKAVYLCKLPAFVDWPASSEPAGTFVLCIVGGQPFGAVLDRAADGQTVRGRPIVVRRYATVANDAGCQLMFITGSGAQSVAIVLGIVRGAPVLTVTDGQSDPASIGIINFLLVDGRVRFEIEQHAAAANGLVISSKLLGLAARVRDRSTP